jgi:1-acyl-sn-glycerol-3-phosphate acyltransferase
LENCLQHLQQGGQLFIFPEGTSSLGPKHLPFKSGAVQLLNEYPTRTGGEIQVVPLRIHYECAWAFQCKVQVVVGEPINIKLPASATPLGRVKELKRRMQAALEVVGINVETEAQLDTIQRLALPVRRSLREIGQRLVARGVLVDPMDIFMARWEQVNRAVAEDSAEGWTELGRLVARQKAAYLSDKPRKPDWILGCTSAEDNGTATSLTGLPGAQERRKGKCLSC